MIIGHLALVLSPNLYPIDLLPRDLSISATEINPPRQAGQTLFGTSSMMTEEMAILFRILLPAE